MSGWREAPQFRARATLALDPGQAWLVCEVPCPYEGSIQQAPRWIGDPAHVAFRPFQEWVETGNVRLGTLVYTLGAIESFRRPKLLFEATVQSHPPSLKAPRLLPGTLCIFPGYTRKRLVTVDGVESELDHVTVRETSAGKIVAYYHGIVGGGLAMRRPRGIKVGNGTMGLIHFLTAWLRTPADIEDAGFGRIPVPQERLRGAAPRLLIPKPSIQVLVDRVGIPPEQRQVPSHFYSAFFLARSPPAQEELAQAFRFLRDSEETSQHYPIKKAEYDGPIRLSAQLMDIGAEGFVERQVASPTYRYLVHLRGILPGESSANVSLAAFPSEVPTTADLKRLGVEALQRRLPKDWERRTP